MSRNEQRRIYVGNLPNDIRIKEIEDMFQRCGTISYVDLKTNRGPPFAFVEFEDPRDAADAVHKMGGKDYDGYKLRVEFPRDKSRKPQAGFRNDYHGGRRQKIVRRSQYRVKISGLPPSGSWQDLKDHMREAGDVCFADVYKDGTGVVEYLRYDDMKYALKKLDDSKFRSHEGETSYIYVEEDRDRGEDSGSKYRSRSRSHSPVRRRRDSPYSSDKSDSRSRSRSRS